MFIKRYLQDFTKVDTLLAFLVSCILYYLFTKNLKDAFLFSVCFVVIFLFFLNIISPH